jgi:hypothetical protein
MNLSNANQVHTTAGTDRLPWGWQIYRTTVSNLLAHFVPAFVWTDFCWTERAGSLLGSWGCSCRPPKRPARHAQYGATITLAHRHPHTHTCTHTRNPGGHRGTSTWHLRTHKHTDTTPRLVSTLGRWFDECQTFGWARLVKNKESSGVMNVGAVAAPRQWKQSNSRYHT